MMVPQSPSKQAPWDFTQFSQLPSAALSYFPESHPQSEIFSLSKVLLVLGNIRSHRAPHLGCRGAESPGWFDVSQKKLFMKRDAWAGVLLWWSCQSPVAHSCGLLNHPNSFCGGMFKLTAKFHAEPLLYLLSHFACDGHTVHMLTQQRLHPHWLVQWCSHCSHMHTCAFQSTLLDCQITLMLHRPFLLY